MSTDVERTLICYTYGMNDQIRAAVKEVLSEKGMTQEQIAMQLGVPRTQINRMLNGDIGKVPESWTALADALGLEVVIQAKQQP